MIAVGGADETSAPPQVQILLPHQPPHFLRIPEFAADQRGYDPDADTHDPRRATDPSRARLHTDTESLRIHVTRRDSQRQRVRGE